MSFVARLLHQITKHVQPASDELMYTVGPYESVPTPGTLYPSEHPDWYPEIPHHRVTRVMGVASRDLQRRGWRAVYGVKV